MEGGSAWEGINLVSSTSQDLTLLSIKAWILGMAFLNKSVARRTSGRALALALRNGTSKYVPHP